jgi:hypothetical protein
MNVKPEIRMFASQRSGALSPSSGSADSPDARALDEPRPARAFGLDMLGLAINRA